MGGEEEGVRKTLFNDESIESGSPASNLQYFLFFQFFRLLRGRSTSLCLPSVYTIYKCTRLSEASVGERGKTGILLPTFLFYRDTKIKILISNERYSILPRSPQIRACSYDSHNLVRKA